ncbi:hypothetical protein ACKI2N_012405 [Cupriavidus sp. 30B13]|uniref:hypothetical protein n=1 Tax=Cupriavidus sp. 30B13 TaxID=3384241 RepID=UPI003B8FE4C1
MSGVTSATAIAGLAAAAISAGATVYSSNQQRKAAESAAKASQQAATAAPSATQSAKAPSTQAQNNAAGIDNSAVNTGAGNTLLTGATGVDPNQLGLGRNTLGANTLLGG